MPRRSNSIAAEAGAHRTAIEPGHFNEGHKRMEENRQWGSRGRNGSPVGAPAKAIGYASCALPGDAAATELKEQARVIAEECKRRGLELLEVVGEHSPRAGKGTARPGLEYALDRIDSGAASGLVVVELSRLTHSVAELGRTIQWLLDREVRLVASIEELDTGSEAGRHAAGLLVAVSQWERSRISERTRHGLELARMNGRSVGRPAVADDPDLSQRIAAMRADGMTLQAIADQLNAEGVPTVRGGAKWRHSSVQAAAGYRRGERSTRDTAMSRPVAAGDRTRG
jgi:DNA invertase Pin-like site-specific DNA recombinase